MRRCSEKSCPGPGYTLIELLVVIAIIAVLIAITAPAIRGAVIASREAVLLSRLHGITQATEAYVGDHQFQLPQAGIPHKHDFSIYPGGLWYGYFAQSGFWTIALWPYFGEPNHPGMNSPWDFDAKPPTPIEIFPSFFQQNYAMFTQPRLWSPTDPIIDESQLVAPRASEVAHPSNKVAFFLDFPLHLFDSSLHVYVGRQPPSTLFNTPIALADSSARLLPYQDLPPMVTHPWGGDEPARIVPHPVGGLMRTLDGVLGRDF